MPRIKRLRIFAGPSGSGKSTLYDYLVKTHVFNEFFYIYVNMLFLLFLFLFLFSCSEDLYYNEATPHISIEILNRSDTISVGDTVLFHARINPSTAPVNNYYWMINSKKTPRLQSGEIFDSSGVYKARFYAVDFLGDTLSEGLTISVANKPICNHLGLDTIYGSPIFKWNCYDIDGDKLTYNFLLKDNKDKTIANKILQEDSLQLGNALPDNYWEVRIIATNSFAFKDTLYSKWEAP